MMIGWFPVPYSDETFDSICYRYAKRMHYSHKNALGEDLFGNRILSVAVDVPRHLTYLIEHLPPGCEITADKIIEGHTFLPYYRPFLKRAVYAQLITQIMSKDVTTFNVLGALSRFRKHVPRYLRYCPECVTLDRQHYGETYWHRQHQLPGVYVCPMHFVWLEDSQVYAKHGSFAQGPITAEEAIAVARNKPRPIGESQIAKLLLRLSWSSNWLLTQSLDDDAETLFQKYYYVLRAKGYIHGSTTIFYRDKFKANFLSMYPPDFLTTIGFGSIAHNPEYWSKQLTRKGYRDGHLSVLGHILFIQFLCQTLDEFFALPKEWQPFGNGPWPCMNPVCDHYLEPVIDDYFVMFSRNNCVEGQFECKCGYVYRLWAPENPYQRGKPPKPMVVTQGSTWEDHLRRLWNDSELSVKDICRTLGVVSYDTLKRHVIRLELNFDRGYPLVYPTPKKRISKDRQLKHPKYSVVEGRQKLTDLMNQQPDITRNDLRRGYPTLYEVLWRQDTEWLENKLPVRARGTQRVNWLERDAYLADKIIDIAETIRNEPGKPVRVTKTEIARRTELTALIVNGSPNLPKTKAALEKILESREDYAIRRTYWAKEYFIEKKVVPRWWVFVQTAGIEKSLFPRVEALSHVMVGEIEDDIR